MTTAKCSICSQPIPSSETFTRCASCDRWITDVALWIVDTKDLGLAGAQVSYWDALENVERYLLSQA